MNLSEKTILNVLAKSSEAVLLLLSSIVMVRVFPKAEYGTFLQIMLIVNTVTMLTYAGFPQSIYYFFQRAVNPVGFVKRNVALSLVLSATAALTVYMLQASLASWFNNPLLAQYGWAAPLLLMFHAPSFFREPILISHGSLIANSATMVTSHCLYYIPAIVAAFLSDSLLNLLWVMVMAAGLEFLVYLGAVAWVVVALRQQPVNDAAADEEPKEHIRLLTQLKYSLPIGVSSYMGVIQRQIDQIIVSSFFTPRDFAVYSRGAMQIPFISTIRYTVNNIKMPEYVRAYRDGDVSRFLLHYHQCIEKIAKINFPIFAFLFVVAPSIVTLLFTDEYLEAAPILRVYLCMLLTTITVYAIVPRASGETTHIFSATLIGLISNIALSVVFVLLIGPLGAAMATVFSMLLSSAYYVYQSCRILKISVAKIFPWGFLIRLFGIAVASSLPIYGVEYVLHAISVPRLLALGIESVLYGYICLFFMIRNGFIVQEEFDLLNKWLRFNVQGMFSKIFFYREQDSML